MCMCNKPTINGEYGYCWNDKTKVGVYKPNPPALTDGEVIIYDEPGRCGGVDSHSFHLRLTRRLSRLYLLVRHGGGDERHEIHDSHGLVGLPAILEKMDAEQVAKGGRYWLLLTLFHTIRDSATEAKQTEKRRWTKAAAEKRIKTRKQRGSSSVKVWIEDAGTTEQWARCCAVTEHV